MVLHAITPDKRTSHVKINHCDSCRNYFKLMEEGLRTGGVGDLTNEQEPDAFAWWLNMRGANLRLLDWDVVYGSGSAPRRRPSIRRRWHINVAKPTNASSTDGVVRWCQSVKLMRAPWWLDGKMKLPLPRQRHCVFPFSPWKKSPYRVAVQYTRLGPKHEIIAW